MAAAGLANTTRRLRMALRWLLPLLAGCAAHVRGFVVPTDSGTAITTLAGEEYTLVLSGQSAPLAHLDGHLTQVDGQRIGRSVRVAQWRVIEGLHGLPVWVGAVQRFGAQVGVQDLASQHVIWVDEAAARALAPHLGDVVLVEGWVDGPQRVRVAYWRPLH